MTITRIRNTTNHNRSINSHEATTRTSSTRCNTLLLATVSTSVSLKPAVHSLTKRGRAPSGQALLITCPATHSSEHCPYPCDNRLACCHQYPIQLCDQVLADIWCQYHCISTDSSHQDDMLHSCLQLLLNYDLTDVMCASWHIFDCMNILDFDLTFSVRWLLCRFTWL